MDLETAIRERRSIRVFKTQPVSDTTILELLDIARWSPSWANTQSSSFYVVTGKSLETIKETFRAKAKGEAPRNYDINPPKPQWPPQLAARTKGLYAARAEAVKGVPVTPTTPSNADFFQAPVLILLAIDQELQPEYPAFDAGILAQSIGLAAHARGLGTVIMAQAVGYPDVLRQVIPEAAGKRFVIGIALGYPDWDAPVNRFPRERVSLDQQVHWAK